MIAVLVALIGVFGIGSLIFQATVTNKNQGTEVTRATIYAQDKIEKLLSLSYSTCNQGVSTNPIACDTAYSAGPPALGLTGTGWNTGLVAGGIIAPMQKTCPTSGSAVGYVDFLDINGSLLPSPSGSCSDLTTSFAYVRMWSISDVTTDGPYQKQITVAVWSQAAIGQTGQSKPVVVLTSYLSHSGACSAAEKTAGCQY
jgi:hypothetical protein